MMVFLINYFIINIEKSTNFFIDFFIFLVLNFIICYFYDLLFVKVNRYLTIIFKNNIKRLHELKSFKVFSTLFFYYLSYVFFLRNFFSQERPSVFYILPLLGLFLFWCPLIVFSFKGYIMLNILFGMNCIIYDFIGENYSNFFHDFPQHSLTVSYFVFLSKKQNSKFVIIRQVFTRAYLASMFLGKTAMTPTGRGYITVGISSGILFGINEHLNRRNAADIAQKNRTSAEAIAEGQNKASTDVAQKKLDVAQKKLEIAQTNANKEIEIAQINANAKKPWW